MAAKRISILIVEDEPLTQEVTTHYLERAGFTVHCAATGESALAILRQEGGAVDWLLTDLNLPGSIDGWIVGAVFHCGRPRHPCPRAYSHPCAEKQRHLTQRGRWQQLARLGRVLPSECNSNADQGLTCIHGEARHLIENISVVGRNERTDDVAEEIPNFPNGLSFGNLVAEIAMRIP
jgi:hypothetical protein